MQELIKKIQRFFKSQTAATTKEPNYYEAALSRPKTSTKETLLKLIELEQREEEFVKVIEVFKENLKDKKGTLFVRDSYLTGSGVFVNQEEKTTIAKLSIQSAERDLAEVRKQISEIKVNAD